MSCGEKQLLGRRNERERNGTGGGDGGREKAWGAGWKKSVGEEMDGERRWGREEGGRRKMEKSWMCLGERRDLEEMKAGKRKE